MDLRDRFAAHFAAALVDALADSGQIAQRAYDLAEAMLIERARRVDAEEGSAAAHEPRRDSQRSRPSCALNPVPTAPSSTSPSPSSSRISAHEEDLDPSWLEPPYDPSFGIWRRAGKPEPSPLASPSRPPGPGLVRTTPEAAEEAPRKERSA